MSTYSPFIFRMPAGTPDLDFASLKAYIRRAYGGEDLADRDHAEIGTTVTVTYQAARAAGSLDAMRDESVDFILYSHRVARIYADRVHFLGPDDPHMATTAWIARILYDNAIGTNAGRIRRRKRDGEGPLTSRGYAGLLVIDWDRERPVIGRVYPVGDIAGQRRRDAEWQAKWAAEREQYAAESRRREALKTCAHPVLGSLYAIGEEDLATGSQWTVVDGTFYDRLGWVRDMRVGPGGPPCSASPDPEQGEDGPEPVFTAFTTDSGGRSRFNLGTYPELAGALTAVGNRTAQTRDAGRALLAALTSREGQETGS